MALRIIAIGIQYHTQALAGAHVGFHGAGDRRSAGGGDDGHGRGHQILDVFVELIDQFAFLVFLQLHHFAHGGHCRLNQITGDELGRKFMRRNAHHARLFDQFFFVQVHRLNPIVGGVALGVAIIFATIVRVNQFAIIFNGNL
ncbi:hypothetical protein D3C76_571300 [compost metagenome]